jgi:phage gp29-like protein
VRPRQGSAAANLEATEAERNLQKIIERSLKKDGSALKPWLADAIAFFKRYDSSEAAAKAMGALYRSLPRDRLVDAIAQQMLVCHLAGMDSVEAEYQNAANQTSP